MGSTPTLPTNAEVSMKFFLFLMLLLGAAVLVYGASEPRIWGPFFYPLQYRQTIQTYARTNDLDSNLVAAVIYEESRFNAGQQSRAGAIGLMQLLPTTAESVSKSLGESDFSTGTLLDPDRNVRYGTAYLKYLLGKYNGDLDWALAAYNAGETNVDSWLAEKRGDIPFPETDSFVAEVKQSRKMYDTIYGHWYEQ